MIGEVLISYGKEAFILSFMTIYCSQWQPRCRYVRAYLYYINI